MDILFTNVNCFHILVSVHVWKVTIRFCTKDGC